MEKLIDFGTMCRICLSEKDCIDITDENRVIISTKQSDDDQDDVTTPIKNAFFYFSSLRDCISEAPMICANCANRLASAYDFAMKVSDSDKRFVDLFDESSVSKIIECVDEVESAVSPQIVQFNEMADISNVDELDDSITVSDHDQQDYDESCYVVKTGRTMQNRLSEGIGNYVAVPQYTITTQPQEVDMSDISLLSKDRTTPVIVKTVDVAAVHIASDNLDFNDSFLCKDYENDKDSMYMCKYCPKAFASSHHLIVHTKKSHVCQFCLKGFRLPTELYEHIRTHKDFRCHICKKPFNTNSNLRSHLRKIHNLKLPANTSLLTL
ncbi:transcriptional regulator ovo [Bradysia coprophila]|uniref:transcriptional regulator ovo n=1 Tax=Bradysia coprophila TaxID=38358 RepID=UPI00187D79B8|nr:transcriptional regulator ovo [Bradysia coprophila]